MGDTITLQGFLAILRKRILLIIALLAVSLGLAAGISYFVITPIYQAETQLLVNQKSDGLEANAWSQQMQTNLQVINTYNEIITTPAILNIVIQKLKLDITPSGLKEQITVSSESNSQVITITVNDEHPSEAVEIANTVAETFKEEIPGLMSVDNINILSPATLGEYQNPIKPNILLNMIIGAVIGIMLGIGLAFLLEMFDTTIKTETDIERVLELPVIGVIGSITPDKEHESLRRSRKMRK